MKDYLQSKILDENLINQAITKNSLDSKKISINYHIQYENYSIRDSIY